MKVRHLDLQEAWPFSCLRFRVDHAQLDKAIGSKQASNRWQASTPMDDG
jgi:hypothetical protein